MKMAAGQHQPVSYPLAPTCFGCVDCSPDFVLASVPDFRNPETTFIVLGALGFLITDIVLVVSSKKGQRIGDILARTILNKNKPQASIEETVFQEVADNYTPFSPDHAAERQGYQCHQKYIGNRPKKR